MDRMEDRLILPDHGACPRDGANPDLRLLVAAAPAVAATATAVDDHENDHHDSDCNKSCDHPSLG
jgi:hypothetical protein